MNSELLESARALGESLHQSDTVQAYLNAKAAVESDPQLTEKETHLLSVSQAIALRQQSDTLHKLTNQELQEYDQLRGDLQQSRLIRSRDRALGPIQSLFSASASEITYQLGLDFTKLALAKE